MTTVVACQLVIGMEFFPFSKGGGGDHAGNKIFNIH
jgi:hypothetical protein